MVWILKLICGWLLTPAISLLVAKLERDSKAESERADLWRTKYVGLADAHERLSQSHRELVARNAERTE